jgi:hypothetical protein
MKGTLGHRDRHMQGAHLAAIRKRPSEAAIVQNSTGAEGNRKPQTCPSCASPVPQSLMGTLSLLPAFSGLLQVSHF